MRNPYGYPEKDPIYHDPELYRQAAAERVVQKRAQRVAAAQLQYLREHSYYRPPVACVHEPGGQYQVFDADGKTLAAHIPNAELANAFVAYLNS